MWGVFQRNFTAYFLNPTGYVFLCVFTLACSCAAFLPDDFVNSNLANLDQLNRWFPVILLIFVPSVTMGIWADERRFGTEELLLTSPLSTGAIILGKYAAAAGIYTVSLAFASISNGLVLSFLGSPDLGLFASVCFGYWLIGLAMLSLGMFASFLTAQLTVAYLAGLLINVPLLALQWADALPIPISAAERLQAAGMTHFLEPFGRGMVRLSSILYFFAAAAIGLWLASILLRRRWDGVRFPVSYTLHMLFRLTALIVLAASGIGTIRRFDVQSDWTAERLGTLSNETIAAIEEFHSGWPVTIEAYISGNLPPELLKTRTDLLTFLDKIKEKIPGPVHLAVRRAEPNTAAAYQLEKRYDIRPKTMTYQQRGQSRSVPVFLTVVFQSGPKTAVIPFMHKGLSVEYELLSSLMAVSDKPRRRLGVIMTDAALFGRTDRFGDMVSGPWPILTELARRYTIVPVDLSQEMTEPVDALLAVQPSTLSPEGMNRFLAAVRSGMPTLIFEDPWPLFAAETVAGTAVPKRPGMPGFAAPKGDIGPLWSMLGILFGGDMIWKNYNPYPKLAGLAPEFVFVDAVPIQYEEKTAENAVTGENAEISDAAGSAAESAAGLKDRDGKNKKAKSPSKKVNLAAPFNPEEPAVAMLDHLLFPFTGYFVPDRTAGTIFQPWIQTEGGGTSSVADILSMGIKSRTRSKVDREGVYTLCARITGDVPRMFRRPDDKSIPQLNVVLTSDLDLLTGGFFTLRELGTNTASGMALDFDNVTFVLNAIDRLIGEDDLIPVRSRRTRHRRLDTLEEATRSIRDRASAGEIAVQREFEEECRAEEAKMNEKIAELVNRGEFANGTDPNHSPELQSAMRGMQHRLNQLHDEKKKEYDRKSEETRRRLDESIRTIQGRYKLMAVLLPPIPPLVIGLAVAWRRRRISRRDRR